MARFAVVLTPDLYDGGYTVTVPALPGIVTDGETVAEALERAREAIDLHINGLSEDQLAASGARFDLQIDFVDVPALAERRASVSSAADSSAGCRRDSWELMDRIEMSESVEIEVTVARTSYVVVLTPNLESSGYSVMVPLLPGCFTGGETVEEARSEVIEAITYYLELPA